MMKLIDSALMSALVLLFTGPSWADGPGFGNLEYFLSEQWQQISIIDSPLGHGNAAMVNGYLMVVYSSDGGGGLNDGGIEFWDVSNPRSPSLAIQYDNAQTHRLREAHNYTFSNSYGPDLMVTQGVHGVQFWDVTDPLAMTLVHDAVIDGINGGAYSGAWWVFWQAPYLYIAAQGAGLYVIDASDVTNLQVIDILAVGELAGIIPAVCYAVGNLLVIGESQAAGIATLNISNPAAPVLIQALDGHNGYSHLFAAGKILTSGGNGSPSKMYRYDVSDAGAITLAGEVGSGFGNGGYGSYQDGNFFSGFSWNFGKLDVDSLLQYGAGSSGINGRDEDFAQVIGNVVFVGDDHGVGSALVPHVVDPDTTGPAVHWISPADGATQQALTSRVGLSLSDNVDVDSLDGAHFSVRPLGGTPLSGKYSVQMGLVNFSPDSALLAGTTYQVTVDGLKDWVGNSGPSFTSTFTTAGSSSTVPLLSNIVVDGISVATAPLMATGSALHTDSSLTITDPIPNFLVGQPYLPTPSVSSAASPWVSFDLGEDSTLFLLWDDAALLPAWIQNDGWSQLAEGLSVSEGLGNSGNDPPPRSIWAKSYNAGSVVLPSVALIGGASNYAVAIATGLLPLASLSSSGPEVVGGEVSFSVATSNATGAESYSWSFGDGTAPVFGGNSIAHSYTTAGRFGVTVTVANVNGTTSSSMVQIVHHPWIGEPRQSQSIAANDTHVFTVLPDHDRVVSIDSETLEVAFDVAVGDNPQTLALSNNGDLWVVNQDSATISVLDASSGALLSTRLLPFASRPYGIVFDPISGQAYVTLEGSRALIRMNSNGGVVGWAGLTHSPRAIGLSPDGRLFASRFLSGTEQATVWEFSTSTLAIVRTVELPLDPGVDTELSGRGVLNYLSAIIPTPDARSLWIPSKKDNVLRGHYRDGQALNFESLVRTSLARIDLGTGTEDLPMRQDLNDRNMAQSGTASPLGDLIFVALLGSNAVDVFDTQSGQRVGACETGRAPRGLLIRGGRLYVNNFLSRSLSVFDIDELLAARSNVAIPLGEIALTQVEPLSAEQLAGKKIFYNAADPRMSRDGYVSCASCHLDGGHDGQLWDFTQAGEGLRNTITLRGRAGMGHGRVHWTANFDEIQDFEHDIRHFAGGTGFLTDEQFEQAAEPLGVPKGGMSPELDAIAAYVSTLSQVPNSPFRNVNGTLSPQAASGRQVFIDQGCHQCHGGPIFSDGLRHDVGTLDASSGQGQGASLAGVGFETPTLLGIWNTPPYLHNGQAETLDDVLSNTTHVGNLTTLQRSHLVSYLRVIDATAMAIDFPEGFLRGDFNGDGQLALGDAIGGLAYLFEGGALPTCFDAADSNDDGAIDVSDSIAVLGYLFMPGSLPPAEPFPLCGLDSTSDALVCQEFGECP